MTLGPRRIVLGLHAAIGLRFKLDALRALGGKESVHLTTCPAIPCALSLELRACLILLHAESKGRPLPEDPSTSSLSEPARFEAMECLARLHWEGMSSPTLLRTLTFLANLINDYRRAWQSALDDQIIANPISLTAPVAATARSSIPPASLYWDGGGGVYCIELKGLLALFELCSAVWWLPPTRSATVNTYNHGPIKGQRTQRTDDERTKEQKFTLLLCRGRLWPWSECGKRRKCVYKETNSSVFEAFHRMKIRISLLSRNVFYSFLIF